MPLLPRTPVWSAPVWAHTTPGSLPCCAPGPVEALCITNICLRKQDRLMSQLLSLARKFSYSLNSHSCWIAPFARYSNNANTALCIAFHTHDSINFSLMLKMKWFHVISRFPFLSVAKATIVVEKCVRQPWSWGGATHLHAFHGHFLLDKSKYERG